jgi:hypothetical protein
MGALLGKRSDSEMQLVTHNLESVAVQESQRKKSNICAELKLLRNG